MTPTHILAVTMLAVGVSSCAYRPIVDRQKTDMAKFESDVVECRQIGDKAPGAGAGARHQRPAIFSERRRISDLAIKHQLPSMHGVSEYVEAGRLLSYVPSYSDFFRRAAVYVDKILKGAMPGNLPIEQPTTFELWINLKTARILGLKIPQSFLVRADRVIE